MKKLLDKLSSIDDQKKAMLMKVGTFTVEQQHFTTSPDSWSMIQVLSHLIVAENGVLAYIGKKMQDPSRMENNGFSGTLRSYLLGILLNLPLKFKAPKALPIPKNIDTLEDLEKNWNENSLKFKTLIDNLPPNFEDKQIFKHIVAGKFNLEQTFNFISNHMAHHFVQLERIGKNIKK